MPQDIYHELNSQLKSFSEEIDIIKDEVVRSDKKATQANIDELTEQAKRFNEKQKRPWYARLFLKE